MGKAIIICKDPQRAARMRDRLEEKENDFRASLSRGMRQGKPLRKAINQKKKDKAIRKLK